MENLQGLSIEGIIQEKKKALTGLICAVIYHSACVDKDAGWSGFREDLSGLHLNFVIYSGDSGSDLRRGFFLALRRVPPTSSYAVESSP